MKIIITKIIVILLVVAIAANGFIFPKKANAILGLGDIVFDPAGLAEAAAQLGAQIAKWIKDHYEQILRDQVAKRIIDYIVDQTVTWIQGGGTPKFVSNWSGFLKDAGNIAFDQIVKDVGLSRLCSPFDASIRISLYAIPKFSERINCTLDEVVANIEDFYNDFSNGGWMAYNEAWQPQNNYYGMSLMIADETLLRTDAQTEAAKSEAVAGGGFLSVKKCKGGGQVNQERGLVQDTDGKWCSSDDLEVQTPGSLAGQAIASAITADTQWAANIQSWTSALVNAAINRLTKEGLNTLKTMVYSNDSGSYYPSEYGTLSNTMMQYDKDKEIAEITKIIDPVECLYDIKQLTASSSGQLVGVLTQIKDLNCEATSSLDKEIVTAQKNFVRVTKEVKDLTDKIDEGKKLITQITNATTTEDQAALGLEYSNFIDKYSSTFVANEVESTTNSYGNYGSDTGAGFCSSQTTSNVQTVNTSQTSQTNLESGDKLQVEIDKLNQTIKNEVDPPLITLLVRAIAFLQKLDEGNLSCKDQANIWVGLEFLKADFFNQAMLYDVTGYPNRANTLRNAMNDLCSVLSEIATASAELMQAEKESQESANNLANAQARLNNCKH